MKREPILSSSLDLAPPKYWRRLVPTWLRALIWVDASNSYDAFLSYSWKADSEIAPVIQSTIHRFLCPWYKLRAKTVFRDLSCLPAGSSLEKELFARLDQSTHLIVLACPEASTSRGMELEASYWFSQKRGGEILIIITNGECKTWDQIRTQLLPPSIRDNLTQEPLWIPLQHRRSDILGSSDTRALREFVIEELKQILLRFYPGKDWGILRGEESTQRRNTLRLLSGLAIVFLFLASSAILFAVRASRQQRLAESRQFAAQSQQLVDYDPPTALRLAINAGDTWPSEEAHFSLARVLEAPLVSSILHHHGSLTTVRFSPDGRRIATASHDGTARIWDTEGGRLLAILRGHSGKVVDLAFSSDGNRLLTGDESGTAYVWDASEKTLSVQPRAPGIFTEKTVLLTLKKEDDPSPVNTLSFSSDGKRIITTFADGTAELWNAVNGERVDTMNVCTDWPAYAMFSPDSNLFMTWGSGCVVVNVLNAKTGQRLFILGKFDRDEVMRQQGQGRDRWVNDAIFFPDSRTVFIAMRGSDSELWDSKSGAKIRSLAGVGSTIVKVAVSSDGKRIATAEENRNITVRNTTDFEAEARLLGHVGEVFKVQFTPENNIITASKDNTVRLWHARDGEVLARVGGDPTGSTLRDAAISPNLKWIATARSDNTARVWDTLSSHPLKTLIGNGQSIKSASFFANGEFVATADVERTIRVWHTSRATEVKTIRDFTKSPQVAFVPLDARHILVVDRDSNLSVINSPSGTNLPFLTNSDPLSDVRVSPIGQSFAGISQDRQRATVWDLASRKELVLERGRSGIINSFAFSRDGNLAVVGSDNKTATVWDTSTGRALATLKHSEAVIQAEFLSNKNDLLTIDRNGVGRRWSVRDEQLTGTLNHKITKFFVSSNGQRIIYWSNDRGVPDWWLLDPYSDLLKAPLSAAKSARFSPNGKSLSSILRDHTVKIWDADTGKQHWILRAHTAEIVGADYSIDGSRILTVSKDKSIRLWSTENGQLLATFHVVDPKRAIFSPDGKYILAIGSGKSAFIYTADLTQTLQWSKTFIPKEHGP